MPELFSQFGEAYFRAGERRVIRRLLEGPPIVLATGGGAFMDPATRATVRQRGTSVWLRAPLPVLLRRVALRRNRPLLANGDPAAILSRLMAVRHPIYAEADIVVDCADDLPDQTTRRVASAIAAFKPPRRLPVRTGSAAYDVVVGDGLLHRAGALLAPVLPQKRVVVVTDTNVAPLHGQTLMGQPGGHRVCRDDVAGAAGRGLQIAGQVRGSGGSPAGLRGRAANGGAGAGRGRGGRFGRVAAAVALRGLPFVQLPTTLLAQVDSGVGGKTGINTARGKNLLGGVPSAPHGDRRYRDAGHAAPAGEARRVCRGGEGRVDRRCRVYDWCEQHGAAVVGDDTDAQAEAILRACAFKAQVVGDDEREERPNDGRALLNLGHTFGHAIEAECGYGAVLHGEAVAVGLGLAFRLSAALGHCDPAVADRVEAHVAAVGLPAELSMLNRRFSAAKLMGLMRRDKKMRDGQLHFVLARGIGEAFTASDVPPEAVEAVLRNAGCEA